MEIVNVELEVIETNDDTDLVDVHYAKDDELYERTD